MKKTEDKVIREWLSGNNKAASIVVVYQEAHEDVELPGVLFDAEAHITITDGRQTTELDFYGVEGMKECQKNCEQLVDILDKLQSAIAGEE